MDTDRVTAVCEAEAPVQENGRKTKKKKGRAKRVIAWIVAVFLILAALLLAAYPFISDWYNSLGTEQEVVQYLDYIARPPANKYKQLIEDAREYNKQLIEWPINGDPFSELIKEPDGYYEQLSIPETDVMATLRIPKININLAVFHGTAPDVLTHGVGHVAYSSLPVGGEGSHSVLSAHTGYANQRFFSDLNQMEVGDVFYVTCFGEEMAYRVTRIDVVEPHDSSLLQIEPDKDYCTLVTCTPFGVNTHRLLVRGERCEIEEAQEIEETTETADSTWNREYIKAILLGLAVMLAILLIFIIVRAIVRAIGKQRKKKSKDETKPKT